VPNHTSVANYGTYKAGGVMYVDYAPYLCNNKQLLDPANTSLLSEGYSGNCWSMDWPVDGSDPDYGVQFFHHNKTNLLMADFTVPRMRCPLPSPWANIDGIDGQVFWNWNRRALR